QEQTREQKMMLLSRFIRSEGGLLLGVQGGSFDQGIDYPNNSLKGVIIAGISLARPDLETKSLIERYDREYGKGMEYGYIYPAVQKAIQASGRAIRTEKDKAAIIYLDERFTWSNYRPVFMDQNFVISREPWEKVKGFGWD
ncbi:MAG: helicase C-terminal domain-containing protein, partial [Candidatus Aenigmatarchaeota archaeon]